MKISGAGVISKTSREYMEALSRKKLACSHCDGQCGSAATYAGQACLPLNGRVRGIDWCIHQIVAALNAGGVETVASCCGHGKVTGRIDLADGRILTLWPAGTGTEPN